MENSALSYGVREQGSRFPFRGLFISPAPMGNLPHPSNPMPRTLNHTRTGQKYRKIRTTQAKQSPGLNRQLNIRKDMRLLSLSQQSLKGTSVPPTQRPGQSLRLTGS